MSLDTTKSISSVTYNGTNIPLASGGVPRNEATLLTEITVPANEQAIMGEGEYTTAAALSIGDVAFFPGYGTTGICVDGVTFALIELESQTWVIPSDTQFYIVRKSDVAP